MPCNYSGMDGAEIRRARERMGLTQQELAAHIGVGLRTIGNWERGERVPRNRMGMLERFFASDEDAGVDPLRSASELALLSELSRRAVLRADAATG